MFESHLRPIFKCEDAFQLRMFTGSPQVFAWELPPSVKPETCKMSVFVGSTLDPREKEAIERKLVIERDVSLAVKIV